MTTIQIKKDGQDPQVINVPEGAKIIIEDGVTIVDPWFKDGDIVYLENSNEVKAVAIFKKFHSANIFLFDYYYSSRIDKSWSGYSDWADCTLGFKRCMRHATESEKQLLIDALAKDGKQWNPDTKQIEKLKYIPKDGDCVEFDYIGGNHKKKGYFVAKIINGEIFGSGDWLAINHNSIHCKRSFSYTKNINEWIFRKITPEELQAKFNELGYEYNFETHTAKKMRWKPKANETYYIPKDGDCVEYCFSDSHLKKGYCILNVEGKFIYKKGTFIGCLSGEVKSNIYDNISECLFRKITPEELQAKFNELGYEYNFETHTAKKMRWKPKANETYYIPDVCSDPPYIVAVNEVSFLDKICIERNIAFKTPEEATEIAKKWLQQL